MEGVIDCDESLTSDYGDLQIIVKITHYLDKFTSRKVQNENTLHLTKLPAICVSPLSRLVLQLPRKFWAAAISLPRMLTVNQGHYQISTCLNWDVIS